MLNAYTVDRNDRITAVDQGWDRFALENGGADACAAQVVGARLVDAISGDPVRMFMTAILMRVRASGQAETIPYRCDSDTVKRYYTMTVRPLPDGSVRVEHDLHHDEPGAVTVRVRPAATGTRGVMRCSLCCRIDEGAGWHDPFDGGTNRDLRVVHTVCPECKSAPLRKMRGSQPRRIHMPGTPPA